jgi:tetratricopeptide (TPR) repeat protein
VKRVIRGAIFALASIATTTPSVAQNITKGLSSVELFDLAEEARAAGEWKNALVLYGAMVRDPDIEVRTEARFRSGMLHAELKQYDEAAILFRALLDEKPDAGRARLELARVLALKGDQPGARRVLRQAQAGTLPADVAIVVDQFVGALRTAKRAGGSFQLALAPDSNVNRATAARTLDTVIAPLLLSEDARQKSGLGIRTSAQAYVRASLTDSLALLPRLSGSGSLYKDSNFNDVSTSALVGLEWQNGRDRIVPAGGATWRWYGGHLYASTFTFAGDWLHPIGTRAQLTVSGSIARARYRSNKLQNGALFDATASGEYALSRRAGLGGSLGMTRQTARDPGYATRSGTATLFVWREAGRTTLFANALVRRTVGDERLFLFRDRRREWMYQLSGGATFRALTFRGLAPLARFGIERNSSTVGIYDYRRVTAELGVARAF